MPFYPGHNPASGTITSINTSAPLTGGPITTTGTIGVENGPSFTATAQTDPFIISDGTASVTPLGNTMSQVSRQGTNREEWVAIGGQNNLTTRRANGTNAAPTALTTNDIVGAVQLIGHDGTVYGINSRADINLAAAENWSPTAQGTYIDFRTTANGGTTIATRTRIHNSGNVSFGSLSDLNNGRVQIGGTLGVPGTFAPNGTIATALTALGPTGASTTVQRWLVVNSGSVTGYVPVF